MHSVNPIARNSTFVALLAAGLIVSWATAQNREPSGSAANLPANNAPPTGSASSPSALSAKTNERLRENTKLIDVVGSFQSIGGENVAFTPGPPGSNKDSLRVLENLMLQRVGQVLDENKGARQWTVSGLITEYKGANYLLIYKAVQLQETDSTAAR